MASQSFHNTHSNTYERMSSSSTKTIALQFLAELTPLITTSSYILDNACGPGVVTQLIKSQHPDAHIMATDLAPAMTDLVKAKAEEKGWENVETDVLDVRDLKTLEDNTFTHVITNFGFAPNTEDLSGPEKAAKEIYRVLKPGGVAVVTTWSERNFTVAMDVAVRTVRPHEEPFSWGLLDGGDKGWWLMRHLEEAGFGNKVSVKSHVGRAEGETLEELVGNMMLFKDMFLKGHSDEEAVELEKALLVEIPKLKAFETWDGGVGIRMVAWTGFAWK